MDDVEKLEKQDLDSYILALEKTVTELAEKLDTIRLEKEQLFEKYVDSIAKIYNIGET